MSFEGISRNFSKVGNICQAKRRCAIKSNVSEKQKKYGVHFALQPQPLPLKYLGLHPQNFVRYSRHRPEFSGLGIDFLTSQQYFTIFIAPLLSVILAVVI